jgi:putative tricarboxylic transport membrane protein
MEKRDLISSLFWIGIGLIFCVSSMKLGLYNGIPGAGLFPFIGGIILICLSIIVLISAIKGKEEKLVREKFFPEKASLRKVLSSTLILFAYQMALEHLGYLLTTFLFIIFLLKLIEPQRWITSISAGFLIAALSYIIFVCLHNVRLPKGIIGVLGIKFGLF